MRHDAGLTIIKFMSAGQFVSGRLHSGQQGFLQSCLPMRLTPAFKHAEAIFEAHCSTFQLWKGINNNSNAKACRARCSHCTCQAVHKEALALEVAKSIARACQGRHALTGLSVFLATRRCPS